MTQEQPKNLKSKGIYLLPNLLTTAGLFAGFYGIVSATKGHFATAAISIFIAMIADSLDGRVARLMNANTPFGVQYDSLSDLVSFGLAPAILIYSWALSGIGKFGWLAAFIFTACGAMRLARFNVQVDSMDKRFFKGLPIPAAAAIISSMSWFLYDTIDVGKILAFFLAVITVILAILMVSNIRYHSFKDFDIKGKAPLPFVSLIIVMMLFAAITIYPPLVLFTIFALYGISGPILTLIRLRRIRTLRKKKVQ